MAASRSRRPLIGLRSRRPLVAVDLSRVLVRPSRLMVWVHRWRRRRLGYRSSPAAAPAPRTVPGITPLRAARPNLMRHDATRTPLRAARPNLMRHDATRTPVTLSARRTRDRAVEVAEGGVRDVTAVRDVAPVSRAVPRLARVQARQPLVRPRPAASRAVLLAPRVRDLQLRPRGTGIAAGRAGASGQAGASSAPRGIVMAARPPVPDPGARPYRARPLTPAPDGQFPAVAAMAPAWVPGRAAVSPRSPLVARPHRLSRRAVQISEVSRRGARPGSAVSGSRAARSTDLVNEPSIPAMTSDSAWRRQVRRQPLESPQPLPTRWQPLARHLAGSAAVRYTTGPATRAALTAARALGATTGTVLHLARQPEAVDLPVVAHELVHARSALTRPRFLSADNHGSLDADERATRRTATAVSTGNAAAMVAIARLPVGGAATVVRSPMSAAEPSAGSGASSGRFELARLGATPSGSPLLARSEDDPAPATQPSAPFATTPAGSASQAPAAAQPDVDRIVEQLEAWLLRELERRGGRFGGVF